ncbi:MAG: sensor histidine kinase [Syntrophales bacterium]
MKKKIILGLSIFALMFLFGGFYIFKTTEAIIYDLHRITRMYQTMVLRNNFLLSIKKNQEKIILRGKCLVPENLPGAAGMVEIVERCVLCHASTHTSTLGKMIALKKEILAYDAATLNVFAADPLSPLAGQRADAALSLGDNLIRTTENIIKVTSIKLGKQEQEVLRKINQRKITLFVLLTIGPFFAVGLAFFLIRGLTRPVNSLLDATRRLKGGDLDYRIEGLKDEFGEVAESFNEMASSLKKQMLVMQRTEQLRVCGEMSAGLAHEIRNPLAGMKVTIEVLLSELTMEPQDREALEKVVEQIRHIELLMKNLLNYARPVVAQPTNVDVNKLLEQQVYFIMKHPSFVSGNPRKQIIREFDERLPEIMGDPQQLQQVFLNLLLNAADAVPEGGTIKITTGQDTQKKTVSIEISNTGKGIPAELMARIFLPFFTTKGRGSGTGLGLAVSKRIVEEHGGVIEVHNNVSDGVTFTVALPAGKQVEKSV